MGLLTIIEGTLSLDTDVVQWWQQHSHLGFTQRLTLFFQKVLLAEVLSPIVIFVDEIDTTLSLDFTDDFFAAIRYFYVARAQIAEFHRLSFVLIGVATPGDLIRDPKRTPFNIGQRLDLTDFTFEEAKPLAEGLGLPTDKALQVLQWVMEWTGGHPYLTQQLCSIISQQNNKNWSKADINRVVSEAFFGAMSKRDNNLQFIRDMLTKRAPDILKVLTAYQQILKSKRPVFDEEQSLVKSYLKLSGIIRCQNSVLTVRNQIYREVFNSSWIQEYLPTKLSLQKKLIISLSTTAFILGISELLLQTWELKAYDQMLRLRSPEPMDSRLVLVTVTEDDVRKQKWPLSDNTLNELLAKLQSYQPRIIGVNLYRSEQENFASGLKRRDNIISVCAFSSVGTQEIAPPQNLSINNVGFTDLVTDDDGIVRRSLLFAHSEYDKKCTTATSFATVLAMSYLEKEGVEPDFPDKQNMILSHTKNRTLKAHFKSLTSDAGGYKKIDAGGYQIMLNYRHPDRLAPEVTLTQVLTGSVDPKLFKDRLVIIGTKTPSLHSGFYTPYSALPDQPARMSPALIHAQTTSQLISAVLNGRPQIQYLPEATELMWLYIAALVGTVLSAQVRHPLRLVLLEGIALSGFVGVGFGLFQLAVWIPIVSPVSVLVISSISVKIYTYVEPRLIKKYLRSHSTGN